MNGIELKERLRGGGMVFGCMLSAMGTTRFRGALAGSTLDYVVIDSEHGSRDRKEIQELCGMLRQVEIAPIVRVPVPMAHWVAMALDAGAAGVLVPYCETVEEVQETVATAKWHPLKGEYLRRAVTEGVFPSEETKAYLQARRRESVIIIGIESEPAQRNLDAILDVGDIDGIFIGPNDMTTSLGIPDETKNPKYLDVIRDVVKRSEAHGVPVMVHHQNVEDSVASIELGARFVLHSIDARFMQVAMQEQFAALREKAAELGGEGAA
ncbi:MAG: aldolase/citrate lyase family protein, partial [Dehalococcoidia bacterium]